MDFLYSEVLEESGMVDQKTVAVHPDTYEALTDFKFESRSESFNEAVRKAVERARNGDSNASKEA